MLYITVVSKWYEKQLFTTSLDHHCKLKGNYRGSNSALFLPMMPSLQSFGRLCHVNCCQNTFDWKLCTMHKTSIFDSLFGPKNAQNRPKLSTSDIDFSKTHWDVISRIAGCLQGGLKSISPKYDSQIPQNVKKTGF